MLDEVMTWPELRDLMSLGLTPPVHGLVRSRPAEPSLVRGMGLEPDTDEGELLLRAWLWGERARVETVEGRVEYVASFEYSWRFDAAGRPSRAPRKQVPYSGRACAVITRRSSDDWGGDDFTVPTGEIGRTRFLDRPAWSVELAPPARKPAPIQLVVDASTGLVLQQRNDAFASVDEWTELSLTPGFGDQVFDAPVESRRPAR